MVFDPEVKATLFLIQVSVFALFAESIFIQYPVQFLILQEGLFVQLKSLLEVALLSFVFTNKFPVPLGVNVIPLERLVENVNPIDVAILTFAVVELWVTAFASFR